MIEQFDRAERSGVRKEQGGHDMAIEADSMPPGSPVPAGVADRLLARTARGDRAAFEALYVATAPRLLGLARAVLADAAEAEGVVQAAFVQAWREAPRRSAAAGGALAWLLGIVHARAVERLREARAEATTTHGGGADPADDHELLSLAYLQGLTRGQIATRLGLSLEDATARLAAGMRRLHGGSGAAPSV